MSHVTRRFSIERVTTRERAVVLAGAAVLVLSLALAYGVRPFLNDAATRREMVQAEREALHRQMSVIRGASTMAVELAAASNVLYGAVPRLFPARAEQGGTVAALAAIEEHVQRLATESGVGLDRISARPDSTAGADEVLTRVDVSIGGSAGIQALTDLLDAFERGDKLIRVRRVRLLGRWMDVGPGRLMGFEIELATYIIAPLVADAS